MPTHSRGPPAPFPVRARCPFPFSNHQRTGRAAAPADPETGPPFSCPRSKRST